MVYVGQTEKEVSEGFMEENPTALKNNWFLTDTEGKTMDGPGGCSR